MSENLYRQLIDIYESPINVYDKELRLIFMNRKSAEILGGKPEDFIGKKLKEYFLSPIAKDIMEQHRKLLETGQAIDFEIPIESFGKKIWYWSHVQPVKDKEGNVSMLMVVSYDITERKKVEEKLRRSEYLLNRAQELAHLGSFETDIINNIFERSDEVYRIFGITRDQVAPNERLSQWVHPDDRDYVEKGYLSIAEGTNVGSQEFRIIRPDGEERVVFTNREVIFDDSGVPIKVLGFLQDITERKRAEEKLRRSENLLNRAQELAHIGSFEMDLLNNTFERSDEVYRIFGITRDQVGPEDRMSQGVHPDDSDYVEKGYQDTAGWINVGTQEFRIIRPDGEERVVFTNRDVIFDDSGVPIKALGYIQDITERKRAEEKLRRSENLLNRAQELAHFGSFERDMINKSYERSDGLFRIFGITRDEVGPEDRMSQWVHPDDRDYVEKVFQTTAAGLKSGPLEFRIIRPGGEERVVIANEDIIFNDSGVPIKSVGYLLDITERKKAEKERERLILELQEALTNIKTLKGLLPICTKCKKIRNDKGYWSQIEEYIQSYTDASFTHSLCPVCVKELYGDEDWYKKLHDK